MERYRAEACIELQEFLTCTALDKAIRGRSQLEWAISWINNSFMETANFKLKYALK